jgi:hypothetical protein
MSVERSVFTRQPAMSGSQLREVAGSQGLAIRFLDLAGMPLGPNVRLDEPMNGQGYVLIGWAAADAESTELVERALRDGDKSAVDRLGVEGKLGWCSIYCGEFDYADYEASLMEGLEEVEDEEPAPVDDLERMSSVRTEYSFRCGTTPRHCSDLLEKVADLVRDATDGFGDE